MEDLALATYIISFVTLYFGLGYGLLILNHKRAGKEGFLDIPLKKHVYISFGPRDLSKNLNRVGGIDLGVEKYQNDNLNVGTYQRAF